MYACNFLFSLDSRKKSKKKTYNFCFIFSDGIWQTVDQFEKLALVFVIRLIAQNKWDFFANKNFFANERHPFRWLIQLKLEAVILFRKLQLQDIRYESVILLKTTWTVWMQQCYPSKTVCACLNFSFDEIYVSFRVCNCEKKKIG